LETQLKGMACLEIPVFFHSDGNLTAVMDDLVGIGFHGFQCLESEAGMDLGYLKATYGQRVCLWGNLDPAEFFIERKPEELEKAVRLIIDVAAPGGGFIFGTSSGLVDGMRPENLETVYRTVRP
jgi:uroporphyrinogen decarboxylase